MGEKNDCLLKYSSQWGKKNDCLLKYRGQWEKNKKYELFGYILFRPIWDRF